MECLITEMFDLEWTVIARGNSFLKKNEFLDSPIEFLLDFEQAHFRVSLIGLLAQQVVFVVDEGCTETSEADRFQ